jgi:hypothetical protein
MAMAIGITVTFKVKNRPQIPEFEEIIGIKL